jgi:hypothetical protein
MTAPLDGTSSDAQAAIEVAQAQPRTGGAGGAAGAQVVARIPPDCVRSDVRVEVDTPNRYVLPQVPGVGALRKMVQGSDLVVSVRGLGALVLDEFVTAAQSSNPPLLVLGDGTVLTARQALALPDRAIALDRCQPQQTVEQIVQELAQIAPAAGPTPQALPQVAPAAGPIAPGVGATLDAGGTRFDSIFNPTPFLGLAYNPVDPLAFGRTVPELTPGGGDLGDAAPLVEPSDLPPGDPGNNTVVSVSNGAGKEDLGAAADQIAAVPQSAAGPIRLPITVTSNDPTEIVVVNIAPQQGVDVSQVRINDLEPDPDGWFFTKSEVEQGLNVTRLDNDSDRDILLTVTVTTIQDLGDDRTQTFVTGPTPFTVVIDAVADLPVVTSAAASVSGPEDTPIDLPDITTTLQDNDGSESIERQALTGLPPGAQILLNGTPLPRVGDAVEVTGLTPAQINNLQILPPPHFAGSFTITLVTTVFDNPQDGEATLADNRVTTNVPIAVNVGPVRDTQLGFTPGAGREDQGNAADQTTYPDPVPGSGLVDGAIPLNIVLSGAPPVGPGVTETVQELTLSGVPAGAQLVLVAGGVATPLDAARNLGGGVWNINGLDLARLAITPPTDSDADIALSVRAVISQADAEGDVTNFAPIVLNGTVVVDAVADDPDFVLASRSVTSLAGGAPIALPDLNALALNDIDGSEALTLKIALPPGAPAGTRLLLNGVELIAGADGQYTIPGGPANTPAEVADLLANFNALAIAPPAGFVGSFDLQVIATVVDSAGDTEVTTADNTITLSDTIRVSIGGIVCTDGAGKEDLGVDTSNGVAPVAPPANGPIAVPILVSLPAGSLQEVTKVVLTNVPTGVQFNLGAAGAAPGSWLIERAIGQSAADFYAALATLQVIALPPESDRDFTVNAAFTIVESGEVELAPFNSSFTVTVDAVVDAPTVSAPDYQRVVLQTDFGPLDHAADSYFRGVIAPGGQSVAVGQTGAWSASSGESPNDGSESVVVTVAAASGQPGTFSVDASDPNNIVLTFQGGAAGFSGSAVTVTGTATATDNPTDAEITTADNQVSVTVDRTIDVAYRPIVEASAAAGVGGGAVQTYSDCGPHLGNPPVIDPHKLLREEGVDHSGIAGIDAVNVVVGGEPTTVSFKGEFAGGYQNLIGWYKIVDGQIVGVQVIWANASAVTNGAYNASDASNTTFLVADPWCNPQDTLVALNGGAPLPPCTEIGFFMVQNAAGDQCFIDALLAGYSSLEDFNANGGLRFTVGPDGKLVFTFDSDGSGSGAEVSTIGNVFFSHDPSLNADAPGFADAHFANGVLDPTDGRLYIGVEDLTDGGDLDYNDAVFSVNLGGGGGDTTTTEGQSVVVDPQVKLADADNAGIGNIERVIFTLSDARAGDSVIGLSGAQLAALGLQQTTTASDTDGDGIDDRIEVVITAAAPGAIVDAHAFHDAAQALKLVVPADGDSGARNYAIEVIDYDGLSWKDDASNTLGVQISNSLQINASSVDFSAIAKVGGDYDASNPLAPIDRVSLINMAGNNQNNAVTLGLGDVLALTDSPDLTLTIEGDTGDALLLEDSASGSWAQSAGPDASHDTWSFVSGGTTLATIVVDRDIATQHAL